MRVLATFLCALTVVLAPSAPVITTENVIDLSVRGKTPHSLPFCSAVVVSLDPALLLTEEHCLTILAEGNATIEDVVAEGHRVSKIDAAGGVVVLRAVGRNVGWRAARIGEQPVVGQPVVAKGYAFGLGLFYTYGRISGFVAGETWFNVEVIRGMSGGGFFDEHDHLISLIRGVRRDGFDSPNGLAFGANPETVRSLVERHVRG